MSAILRSQFRDAVEMLLETQRLATPTLLRKTERFRVGGMGGEKPVAWQGEIVSAIEYDSGTRLHVMAEEVQLATTFPADVLTDDFDDLMDALLALFTANFNAVASNTILQLDSIVPGEVSFVGADGSASVYRGAVLGISLRIWEGRQ